MLTGAIGTLEDLSRALINSIPNTRIRYANVYNTARLAYEPREGRFLQDTPPGLAYKQISIDTVTRHQASEFCASLGIQYLPEANQVDEIFHWVTHYTHLTEFLASSNFNQEGLKLRLQHPILVYSGITLYLISLFKEKYGKEKTKELLQQSCVKWNKTLHHPVRKWGRVFLARATEDQIFPTISFTAWVDPFLTPEQQVTTENFLQSYSSRATEKFDFKYGKKPAYSLALGVELELENLTAKAIPVLTEFLGHHAIFKRDGSVSRGVEICTAPATLDLHKEAFKTFFEKDSDLKVESNCGLHVHVDRKGLDKTQIPKILMFMNDPNNNSFIERIAGRKANDYCQTQAYDWESAITSDSTTKYRRVNLAPEHTIEFRLFAATMDYKQFSRCLEFVQAVVDYTKSGEAACSIKEIVKQDNFKDYIKNKHQFYPELYKFINPTTKGAR